MKHNLITNQHSPLAGQTFLEAFSLPWPLQHGLCPLCVGGVQWRLPKSPARGGGPQPPGSPFANGSVENTFSHGCVGEGYSLWVPGPPVYQQCFAVSPQNFDQCVEFCFCCNCRETLLWPVSSRPRLGLGWFSWLKVKDESHEATSQEHIRL